MTYNKNFRSSALWLGGPFYILKGGQRNMHYSILILGVIYGMTTVSNALNDSLLNRSNFWCGPKKVFFKNGRRRKKNIQNKKIFSINDGNRYFLAISLTLAMSVCHYSITDLSLDNINYIWCLYYDLWCNVTFGSKSGELTTSTPSPAHYKKHIFIYYHIINQNIFFLKKKKSAPYTIPFKS